MRMLRSLEVVSPHLGENSIVIAIEIIGNNLMEARAIFKQLLEGNLAFSVPRKLST